MIPSYKGKKALDAGCGKGVQSKVLEKKGYIVTSVDIVKVYKECLVVDLNELLPFNDNSFDLIYCSEVIEHLKDPEFTAAEFKRVLAPGGLLILTTPNSYCLWFRIMYLLGLSKEKIQKECHIQFFGIKDIRRIFPEAIIYGFWPFILKWKISRGVAFLSPTFIIRITNST